MARFQSEQRLKAIRLEIQETNKRIADLVKARKHLRNDQIPSTEIKSRINIKSSRQQNNRYANTIRSPQIDL